MKAPQTDADTPGSEQNPAVPPAHSLASKPRKTDEVDSAEASPGRWDTVIDALPQTLTSPKRRKTVAAILDASETAITERGIERFTTGDVARIAGLSIGAVYKYFADRVAILDAMRPHRYDAADTLMVVTRLLEDLRSRAHDQLDDRNRDLLDAVISLTRGHL